MVVTRAGANKEMEEELAVVKTKLQYLEEKILRLHLQHSAMNNIRHPESSTDTGFPSSRNFHESNLDFPCFSGDDPTGWIYREE